MSNPLNSENWAQSLGLPLGGKDKWRRHTGGNVCFWWSPLCGPRLSAIMMRDSILMQISSRSLRRWWRVTESHVTQVQKNTQNQYNWCFRKIVKVKNSDRKKKIQTLKADLALCGRHHGAVSVRGEGTRTVAKAVTRLGRIPEICAARENENVLSSSKLGNKYSNKNKNIPVPSPGQRAQLRVLYWYAEVVGSIPGSEDIRTSSDQ